MLREEEEDIQNSVYDEEKGESSQYSTDSTDIIRPTPTAANPTKQAK